MEPVAVACPSDPDRMAWQLGILWDIAFAVMIITAVLGNTAVIWIVACKSEVHWHLNNTGELVLPHLFPLTFPPSKAIPVNSELLFRAGNLRMRTATNLLIFNLSLTDLINTVFNSVFNYIFMKNK
jgi:hypothetical protein